MASQRPYPLGVYPSQEPLDPIQDRVPGNDPSWVAGPVMEMSQQWLPIDVCVGGTQALRLNASLFLPQEVEEDESSWKRRIYHATLSPFTVRIAEQAAGLILRKPIQLVSKQEEGEVDPYWEEFAENCDGYGTSLDAFARRLCVSSILYGHAAVLVDYPSTEPAPNLAAERLLGLRPYLIQVDAKNILGWRKRDGSPIAPITQVRLNELVSEPLGEFGDEIVRQIRVLEPGRWRVYRRKADQPGRNSDVATWSVYAEGTTSLGVIPLAVTYSQKVAELISKPPLLPIADLNISHAQRTADLHHSLHVAALPILTLQGFDESGQVGLSANSIILLPPEGGASYVEPASGAFEAQQSFITEIENQMSSLGISTLFAQKMGAETAESKRLSRTDSDSLLSIVSKDLEKALQSAMEMAAAYVGMEAPQVMLDRDFDLQTLEPAQVTQYQALWTNGAITHQTLLEMLKQGEVLPELDVEREVELADQEKAKSMMTQMLPGMAEAGKAPPGVDEEGNPEPEQPTEGESEIRDLVEKRLKKMSGGDDEED